jgi:predicted RNase H-like HicB family nuclease
MRFAFDLSFWERIAMAGNAYTAIVKRAGDWWIGWVQEVPGVNAQERTKEELLISLRQALREAIKFNRQDARRAAEADYVEEPLAL